MKALCAILFFAIIMSPACTCSVSESIKRAEPPLESKISSEIKKIKHTKAMLNSEVTISPRADDSSSSFTPSFRFVPVAHCQD